MDRNEFEQDRALDPLKLDIECARHPDIFFKWARRAIKSHTEVDNLKLKLKVVNAQLKARCRENPEQFGLARATDKGIDAAVESHESWIKANLEYLRAREQSELLDKVVDTLIEKRRMLEALITLHGQQYFAGPEVPHNLIEAWKEYKQSESEALMQRQKRLTHKRKGGHK